MLFASQAKDFSNGLKILAIKSNGEQKELLSSDKYDDSVRFKLVNDKIYFALFDTKKTSFGYIDLAKGNGNYESIILKETTDRRLDSFAFTALNNKIYYAYTNSNSEIYEYDIKTKKEKILISNLDGPILYSIVDKNIILYNKDGNLYMLDASKNIETKLADNASISAIHNNKIIINNENENENPGYFYNYEYSNFK